MHREDSWTNALAFSGASLIALTACDHRFLANTLACMSYRISALTAHEPMRQYLYLENVLAILHSNENMRDIMKYIVEDRKAEGFCRQFSWMSVMLFSPVCKYIDMLRS